MKQKRVFRHIVLTEEVSPIPFVEGMSPLIPSRSPNETVTLHEYMRVTSIGDGIPTMEHGEEWRTSKRRIEIAYASEFERLLGYVGAFAERVDVVTTHRPQFQCPGVQFKSVLAGDASARPHTSRRFRSLLENAVRNSGKRADPGGPRIVNVDHWLDVITKHFGTVLSDFGVALGLLPCFVPVFAEWLRLTGVSHGIRRRVIGAELGLPIDPGPFRVAVATCTQRISETILILNRIANHAGIEFYRSAAPKVLELQQEFPSANEAVLLHLLFVDDPVEGEFGVPAVGFHIPPPRGGYRLELDDGTMATLARPPWKMGYSIGTSHRKKDSGEELE